jgi:hypothetical protein
MFVVFYSGFSPRSFPEGYERLFFTLRIFQNTVIFSFIFHFSLGGWGVLENLIIVGLWNCSIFSWALRVIEGG